MQRGQVGDLTPGLAIDAAHLGLRLRLPFADSIILATARGFQTTLWTQDPHFANIEGVRYLNIQS